MADVDLDALLADEVQASASIRFGGEQHQLPPTAPASFVAALGNAGWASESGSKTDQLKAGAKLADAVASIVPGLADRVGLEPLIQALCEAWGITGEPEAS